MKKVLLMTIMLASSLSAFAGEKIIDLYFDGGKKKEKEAAEKKAASETKENKESKEDAKAAKGEKPSKGGKPS